MSWLWMSWLCRCLFPDCEEDRNPDSRESAEALVTYPHSNSPKASPSSSSKLQPPNFRQLEVQKMGVQEQIILHPPNSKSNASSSGVRAPQSDMHLQQSDPHSKEYPAKVSSPSPWLGSVYDQSVRKSPQKFTDKISQDCHKVISPVREQSLNKLSELPESIGKLRPVVSPVPKTNFILVESTPKTAESFRITQPVKISHERQTISPKLSNIDGPLKPIKVSGSLSLIGSVHDQSGHVAPQKFPTSTLDKREPMEEGANLAHGRSVIKLPELPEPIKGSQLKHPVAITKVWVESTKKKSAKTANFPSLSGKLHEALHVSETINQSKRNDLTVSSSSTVMVPPAKSLQESLLVDSTKKCIKSDQTVSWNKYKLPVYPIPEHLKDLIQRDKVPEVLRKPVSPSTYTDYFAALLYAEDFYTEKWSDFLLSDVNIELHEEQSRKGNRNNNMFHRSDVDKKLFVKFEIDSVPERRPYLLSRDYVFLQHSGDKSTTFEGSLYRVMKSTHVLAEFGEEFYSQYSPYDRYDVSFSFNRVCLKRCHQAVASAIDLSFRHILFPEGFFCDSSSFTSPYASSLHNDGSQDSVVHRITAVQGADPPYLISGPLWADSPVIQNIIKKAILQICRNSASCRILICAPKNRTCDALAASLTGKLSDSELFRANAAFREFHDVDGDIIPLCSYDGECFITPSLTELKKFRVVTSTFVSSFRLHSCGITAGHFTHIFLVDASGATEPESMIPLANLVGETTAIVVTGCVSDHPPRIRSDIARRNGLNRSYFHRLFASSSYRRSESVFAARLK